MAPLSAFSVEVLILSMALFKLKYPNSPESFEVSFDAG